MLSDDVRLEGNNTATIFCLNDSLFYILLVVDFAVFFLQSCML